MTTGCGVVEDADGSTFPLIARADETVCGEEYSFAMT
jgi:hypothetical protein